MNLLDKLIGWASPSAGLRRVRARTAMEAVRAYDGAKTTRRTDGWALVNASANVETYGSLARLRARSRDLVRNNAYAFRALDVLTANAVGTGILAQSKAAGARAQKQIEAAWAEWCRTCDINGQLDFHSLQALAARTIVESGEVLVRFHVDRTAKDGEIPLKIQVLEPDYLDIARNFPYQGNIVIQGVEFDQTGRRVAYWLFPRHPGEAVQWNLPNFVSTRVPASEVLHVYRVLRPGQVRGVPWVASALVKQKDLDDYEEAELVRKKIEACFAAFVTQEEGANGPTLGGAGTDAQTGQRLESFEPGMVEYLRPGEDVKFGQPSANGGYPEYVRSQLRAIAAGWGVTYEQMTGDLSQVNYSSMRAGRLEFQRLVEAFRWQVLIPGLCDPIFRRFVDTAYLAGVISKPDAAAQWTPPKFDLVDPLKETEALVAQVRAGLITLDEAIRLLGYDPEAQIEAIAAMNAKLDAAGIKLDSDPRVTTGAGGASPKPPTNGDAANG